MPNNRSRKYYEDIEEILRQKTRKKQLKVSGASVKVLARIIRAKKKK
ncbi:MAG: hypothetical protein CEN91_330 [Candidatus Berkelbacteria bacterium Licking1014_85]|uniref:Uncharacterized protein n=1 Tax=Candidatus Berkelbacteria bacterium Licking1014_85 TaxID=2017148 RepID=A0A554LJX1_9BACT|nr:MAG: hypothetical protein CEN91_330 [Candidatus Berkelbacteria bacterium Licking1014_85]